MQVEVSKSDIAKYIEERVRAGDFPTASAMLEEAVARMMREEQDQVTLTPEDVAAIAEAEAEYERGEYEDFSMVAARLRAKYGAR